MNLDEMKKLYQSKMGLSHELDEAAAVTLRVWDGMDGCWCDVVANVNLAFALREWCRRTENGTKATSFHDIDYYRIFPAGRTMLYSGGHTMFRDDDE